MIFAWASDIPFNSNSLIISFWISFSSSKVNSTFTEYVLNNRPAAAIETSVSSNPVFSSKIFFTFITELATLWISCICPSIIALDSCSNATLSMTIKSSSL